MMKHGDKITCPHCSEETFAKKEAVLDGWTKAGDVLVCALCGKKIAELGDEVLEVDSEPSVDKSGLEALLGEKAQNGPVLEVDGTERVFCRDCRHFISHPFMDRCSRHEKDVNPMDDCPEFEAKS